MIRYIDVRTSDSSVPYDTLESRHMLVFTAKVGPALKAEYRNAETFELRERARAAVAMSNGVPVPTRFRYAVFYHDDQLVEGITRRTYRGVGVLQSPDYREYTHTSMASFYAAVGYGMTSKVWFKQ